MNHSIYTDTGLTIKRSSILLLFVAILIFLWSNGFDLPILAFSERFKILTIVADFIILTASGISIILSSKIRYTRNNYFLFIVLILCAVFFPTFINLVIFNGLSPLEIFRSGFFYSGLFIFIILIYYDVDYSFVNKLNTLAIAIVSINVLVIVAASFFPVLAEIVTVKTSVRFETARINIAKGLGSFAQYTFFYLLIMSIKIEQTPKKKLSYILLSGVYIFYFFFVSMSRRTIFALLGVLIYYIFFRLSGRRKIQILFVLLLFIALLFVIPKFETILGIIQSSYYTVAEEIQYGEGSAGVRIKGIEYFFNLFHQYGYIGIGLGSSRLPVTDPLFIGQEILNYNPGDHGIFAVLYQFGFPAIILTIIVLFHIFRDLKAVRLQGMPEHWPIAMAIHLYLVFSIIGLLDIFWKPSQSLWPGIIFFMVWRMRSAIYENRPDMVQHSETTYN
jgi:hypothetical protein